MSRQRRIQELLSEGDYPTGDLDVAVKLLHDGTKALSECSFLMKKNGQKDVGQKLDKITRSLYALYPEFSPETTTMSGSSGYRRVRS